MNSQVKKWGNSLAVRLPRELVSSLGLTDGTPVQLEVTEDGELLLRPARSRRRPGAPSLDTLLEGVTPETIHREVDWGEPRGAEVW